jgi:hypothetical protein
MVIQGGMNEYMIIKKPLSHKSPLNASAKYSAPLSLNNGFEFIVIRLMPNILSKSGRPYLKLSFQASL